MKIQAHDFEGNQYEIKAENYESDGGFSDGGGASQISFTAYAPMSVADAIQVARAILPGCYEIVKVGWDADDEDCWIRYVADDNWQPLGEPK